MKCILFLGMGDFVESIKNMSAEMLEEFEKETQKRYDDYCSSGLQLNMARGKPAGDQLGLSDELLNLTSKEVGVYAEDGTDCRNYGALEGIPECRKLFGEIFGVPYTNVIACGSSSLNLIYDCICQGFTHGYAGQKPWSTCEKRKFIAIVPGYDRHFGIAQFFGFELINVKMTADGPDMDAVEEIIKDPDVKGMFCVPKYSNPDGVTYSDETVERLAAMKPAAEDFRVIWDEAYIVHDLYEDDKDELKNIFTAAAKYGNEDKFIAFASTSKITMAGAGVSALAASDNTIKEILSRMTFQIISYDKMNQLRHSYLLKNIEDVNELMKKHAAYLRPKFEAVLDIFDKELDGLEIASWNKPKGGYFISLNVDTGSAKYVWELCKKCGLTLTGVGATFPYGKDPEDKNLRIAPSYPKIEELKIAAEIVCLAIKLAACKELKK